MEHGAKDEMGRTNEENAIRGESGAPTPWREGWGENWRMNLGRFIKNNLQ